MNRAPLGIFARTFRRSSPERVAAAVSDAGYHLVQLNLNSFGAPTVPDERVLASLDLARVAAAFADRGVGIWGVSLTYNLIDPDRERRRSTTADACRFLGRIPELGARVATICTGTRDATDMWRAHPGNTDPSAWRDLQESLGELLPAARSAGVRLGVEPEAANVIADAPAARRLLDELGRDAELVGVVLDPANLVSIATAPRQDRILTEAFDLLGPHIVCLHAKDVVASGYAAAGLGLLDYRLIFELRARLVADIGQGPVPVIVQDATEDDSVRVRELLESLAAGSPSA